MKRHRLIVPIRMLALLALVAWTTSCSDKTTNPPSNNPTPKELDSGVIAPGNTFPHTFANAGVYNYECTIHSGMLGSVTVEAGQPMSVGVSITNNAFTPANAQVAPGGMVTWTNNGSNHTVTSR